IARTRTVRAVSAASTAVAIGRPIAGSIGPPGAPAPLPAEVRAAPMLESGSALPPPDSGAVLEPGDVIAIAVNAEGNGPPSSAVLTPVPMGNDQGAEFASERRYFPAPVRLVGALSTPARPVDDNPSTQMRDIKGLTNWEGTFPVKMST